MKALELAREEIPAGKIADYVMASAACFPAFKVKEIDRVKYIDGGYQDYMPVGLALRLGADEVIAVDLKAVGIRRKPKDSSVPVKLVRSRWNLGPFLLFEPTLSGRNMALGYLDAKKALGIGSLLKREAGRHSRQSLPISWIGFWRWQRRTAAMPLPGWGNCGCCGRWGWARAPSGKRCCCRRPSWRAGF